MTIARGPAIAVTVVLALLLIGLGAMETLVWGPLAMTDDAYDLDAIHAVLGPEVVRHGSAAVLSWAIIGVLVTLFAVLLIRVGHGPVPLRTALAGWAWLLLGGVVGTWGTGFAMGMDIADAIPPYRSTLSPVGFGLLGASAAAAALLLVLLVLAIARPARGGR